MKRFLTAASATVAVLATMAPATASARSALEGRWRNGKMEIVIGPCGGSALCGTVVKASAKQRNRAENGSGTNIIGAKLITNIRPTGPGSYRGDVYLPDRDMNAAGTIRQTGPNRLNVRGCVLSFLCKSQNWDRISR